MKIISKAYNWQRGRKESINFLFDRANQLYKVFCKRSLVKKIINTFDLQTQSTASDGKISPREIVKIAKEEGLRVIALTDHDTVGGIEEALLAGGEFGVRVVPGIEMSVEERDSHILGFGIDYKNPELLSELEKFRQGRIEGAKKMVENLQAAGFIVGWEDVLREATGGVMTRPHIARAILNRPENKEKLGGISSMHDFFETHLKNDSPNFVKRAHILAKDAIGLIHKSGGVAIWSHPAIHFKDDYDGLEKFLQELIGWGLEGVEVFNPSHIEDDVEFLNSIAAKYNLLRTAGSDFHELGPHERDEDGGHSAEKPGDYETYGFSTEDIVDKLDKAMENLKNRVLNKNGDKAGEN